MASKKGSKKRKVQKKTGIVQKTTRVHVQTVSAEEERKLAARRERLRLEGLERRRKKLIRRQITAEFQPLLKKGRECAISEIAEFIRRFEEDIDLIREALGPFRHSESLPAIIIWRCLSGEADEKLDHPITKSKLLAERKAWLETNLPDPIVVPVEIAKHGPRLDTLTSKRIREVVEQLIGEATPDLQISGSLSFSRLGDHLLQLEFSEGLVLSRTVRPELLQDELPSDCLEGLANASALSLSETADVMQALQQYLSGISPSDILVYYPRMGKVLITAYNAGYWKSPWVQDVLREWRSRQEEYVLNQELREVGKLVERLNRRGPWMISEQYDTEELFEQKVLEVARGIVSEDAGLSQYPINLSYDGGMDLPVLPVAVLLRRVPVGTIRLLRSATFMPVDIHRDILQAGISHLTDMRNCTSEQKLLEIADRENKNALKIVDEQNRRDHPARAQYLAGICRVLLERGMIAGVQFKRTLTCYYVDRGREFFMNDPPRARRYYLLFFQMLYQEGMLEHLKAIAPLDYRVLADFFATYTDRPVRTMKTPRDVRSFEKTQPLAPMLWRATQLLHKSPRKFFDALLELYVIEPDFVRSLLVNLRRVKRRGVFSLKKKGAFTLDYLNVDSAKLLTDIVAYSVESAPTSVTNDSLLEFTLSVLDVRDIAQPVFNDFMTVLASARQFMGTKDVVQKSTLYTDVDRGFLQARGVAGRLAHKQRRGSEESRKKAGRLNRLLEEFKTYVDRMHREFFRSARLEVKINTFTLPRYEPSPVEVQITNADFGPASNVVLKIKEDTSLRAREYTISLDPIFGKDEHIEALYISPLAEKTVELRGVVEYSDQENPNKSAPFQHTINISDPADFKPFYSPYITGDPVRASEMFFGRREELDEIIRLLRGHFQDRITVIHGRRKVGKTSVLYQLKQGDPNLLGVPALNAVQQRYIPVLVDFERFTVEKATWEVYHHIYQSIRQESDLAGIPTPSIPMRDFRDLSAGALLEGLIVQLEQSLSSGERKLLLMFDEFDTLIRHKGEETGLFGFIRELIIKHGQHISFIFVGADQLVGMMKTRTNRLYSMAGTPIEIANLAPEEARLLVIDPMRKVNPEFEWAKGATQLIVRVTARNPYYIQTLCDRIVNNLIAGKRLRATTIDVERGVGEIVNHIGDLADIVDNLSSVEEKIVLTCVAESTRHERMEREWTTAGEVERRIKDVSRKFPRGSIPGVLRLLQARYILDQREDEDLEMKYSIQVPLLQTYIQNTLKLQDVLREGGYA